MSLLTPATTWYKHGVNPVSRQCAAADDRQQSNTTGLLGPLTFVLPKLVERFEASGVVNVIGLEGHPEEVTIRVDGFFLVLFFSPTEPIHLPILQFDVEV